MDHVFSRLGLMLRTYSPIDTGILLNTLKEKQSHYRPDVPRWFQEVKVPRLRDNGAGWL